MLARLTFGILLIVAISLAFFIMLMSPPLAMQGKTETSVVFEHSEVATIATASGP